VDKETLLTKIKSGELTEQEESDLLDEFLGKKKKTLVQLEVVDVLQTARKHPEIREMATKLVSKLKSEMEGRGAVPKEELDKRRKAFWAAVEALGD
jgi:hypothetical protein